ncbi:MAG: chemotaxis protein CheA [Porticoccaceae bacterium]
MSIDTDDEILKDFLIEAGEILETLGGMLVELEQRPRDADLLNTVFRGFHTIKGGAGFLSLNAMVDICHRAEDVFNVLRQGERSIDAGLMDAVFRALDVVKEQFQQLEDSVDLTAADTELLSLLERYAAVEAAAMPNIAASTVTPPTAVTPKAMDKKTTAKQFTTPHALPPAGAVDASAPALEPRESGDGEFAEVTDAEFVALMEIAGAADPGIPARHGADAEAGTEVEAEASELDEMSPEDFERLLDQLHGKGGVPVAVIAPEVESPLPDSSRPERAGPADMGPMDGASQAARGNADATVRVDTSRLDQMMNMVGELVLVRNRLATLKAGIVDEDVSAAIATLELVTSDLQAAVMKTRMQPIKKVFGRFPRVVRDLARSLNKEVELELHGEDTDLDKNLVEALADPLVHLVRNSVDHGIETPAERERSGKSPVGKVMLSAKQEGDHILLIISDDGAGMDADVLRKKAVEKGLLDAESAARLTEADTFSLIFKPGFSTKAAISDISGRGVGMDVVKTRIDQLNGSIAIESVKGSGTRLSIKLPLTLAILPTLMVGVGRHIFALPLSSVSEIFQFDGCKTTVVDNKPCVLVREKVLPLFDLRHWLVRNACDRLEPGGEQVVIAHLGGQRVGLITSRVLGQEEVVIKPLGVLLHGLPGFAGATITGDGSIALILDIPGLIKSRIGREGVGSLAMNAGWPMDGADQALMRAVR